MITQKNLTDLPHLAGCYLFKDSQQQVIYVGKAKDLRKRVLNYFQKNNHDPKTNLLIQDINSVDFIATRTEIEALLLENNLIKKHYPKYNIDMKDAQKYAYIHLTDSEYPFLEVERSRDNNGEYYGPFVSGAIRKQIFDILTRNFRILTKKPSPRLKKLIDKQEYLKRVEKARKILKGNTEQLVSDLKKEMQNASLKKYYEHAINLRNQINALESFKEKQLIELTRSVDSHIINYIVSFGEVYLLIFSIRNGVLEGKQEYIFSYNEDFLNEFLLRYYDSSPIPQEIILPKEVDPILQDYLSKKRKSRVKIIIPQMGDKKQLLDLVLKNVHASFFGSIEKLIELKNAINLPKLPIIMECFDISHLSGTNTVASMVSFRQGVPDKNNYRRFKIRTPTSGDDILALKEVLQRRYSKIKRENLQKPDLIIIDGGVAQLNIAVKVIKQLNMNIPIISLAKKFEEIYVAENRNKKSPQQEEGVFSEIKRFLGLQHLHVEVFKPAIGTFHHQPNHNSQKYFVIEKNKSQSPFARKLRGIKPDCSNNPIILSHSNKALQLLQAIRDEAHRFAISYQKILRRKQLFEQ